VHHGRAHAQGLRGHLEVQTRPTDTCTASTRSWKTPPPEGKKKKNTTLQIY